jgi:hypothetical protein
MNNIHDLAAARHARASLDAGLKNASIGTTPPDRSLSRLARRKDASLRPAKTFRKCESEQSAASARSLTVIPFASAHRSIGCDSIMDESISCRNDRSQPKIFLSETGPRSGGSLKCGMAKRKPPEAREIYLGEWLKKAGLGPTEAAKIAGCTQSYITNISRGARDNVNVLYLLKLSEYMNISVNDFFQKPPSDAQIAPLAALSPEAREMLLRPKRHSRG